MPDDAPRTPNGWLERLSRRQADLEGWQREIDLWRAGQVDPVIRELEHEVLPAMRRVIRDHEISEQVRAQMEHQVARRQRRWWQRVDVLAGVAAACVAASMLVIQILILSNLING